MSNRYVLDSFAILALLNNEPGAARVEDLLRQTREGSRVVMSLINLGEVAYIVERRWGAEKLRAMLAYLEAAALEVMAVDRDQVFAAAHIKARYPLAYADAFAVALTRELEATLLTGDPEFKGVSDFITVEWLSGDP
ncbi:MAG: type II toxin-antitoxin system VapC family toxin [Anaerolineae bacterium]|nr:type II toxin-antitoxin system VapC family toxin [Anaerolineales bacterium]MCQ3980107.1 type II toxin-antitoxin system VapC family toxin [Anaerolineae bacterium]